MFQKQREDMVSQGVDIVYRRCETCGSRLSINVAISRHRPLQGHARTRKTLVFSIHE